MFSVPVCPSDQNSRPLDKNNSWEVFLFFSLCVSFFPVGGQKTFIFKGEFTFLLFLHIDLFQSSSMSMME